MKPKSPNDHLFPPDGTPVASALKRITRIGIGVNPDDLEFMACHGILECFISDLWIKTNHRPGKH